MWEEIDKAVVGMGFASITNKFHLPVMLMMCIAYVCNVIGFLIGRKLKLTPFTVRLLTMHRWFTQERVERELGYTPIIPFSEGWAETIEWFRTNWLPDFLKNKGQATSYGVLHKGSQAKIDGQNVSLK